MSLRCPSRGLYPRARVSYGYPSGRGLVRSASVAIRSSHAVAPTTHRKLRPQCQPRPPPGRTSPMTVAVPAPATLRASPESSSAALRPDKSVFSLPALRF